MESLCTPLWGACTQEVHFVHSIIVAYSCALPLFPEFAPGYSPLGAVNFFVGPITSNTYHAPKFVVYCQDWPTHGNPSGGGGLEC